MNILGSEDLRFIVEKITEYYRGNVSNTLRLPLKKIVSLMIEVQLFSTHQTNLLLGEKDPTSHSPSITLKSSLVKKGKSTCHSVFLGAQRD